MRQRLRVYGRLVQLGHMRQQTADREIEVMQAIAEDYRRKVGAPAPEPAAPAAERGLFDPLEP
ncbi:hypothetical protein PQJ75_00855 [Rhodoplanes sp. TEM]|uniref:Uncharacterized protein n=1 Tax=Rhodoplanes tepidamans TaxID=200616 RepID=A0ABT5J5A2_RHOTP|nr:MULTISPECIES: hypothetical protein [Rhodoplanes]MDC7784802.1 hypothetical protein [Rhodoplanes tepidamans]MDC7982269.1 hypothetical protein [Rhodoplanes sp. TEM]MDQ0356276.1 hypothetical protein [Rhodoplanes tepidamans]